MQGRAGIECLLLNTGGLPGALQQGIIKHACRSHPAAS
jgi:hypothetical protein